MAGRKDEKDAGSSCGRRIGTEEEEEEEGEGEGE
jgi:hypothetical protein